MAASEMGATIIVIFFFWGFKMNFFILNLINKNMKS